MANPALKNGYISVANELVEKLATLSIPSSEMRIVWVVWRKTWGWTEGDRKKDWDWISLSQFAKLTTIKKGNIPKLLKSLVCKRILLKRENRVKFNQNYEEWGVYKRITRNTNALPPVIQTHYEKVIQTHYYKRNKETNTKDIPETKVSVSLIKRKSKIPMKRNSFGKYREDQSSDSFDDCIDLDTGEIARPKPVKGVNEAYWNLLHWSENRRKDFKFINVKKQFKAFKIARENKINPPDLQAKWIEFEKDKFWNTKGFDWMDIVTSLDRKR